MADRVLPSEIKGLTRLYTHVAVPGITEPKLVLNLPKMLNINEPKVVEKSAGEGRDIMRKMNMLRKKEQMLPMYEIELVEFSLFSTKEIDEIAVVPINNPKPYGPGTVRDLLLGPHSHGDVCESCYKDLRGCEGHYGKIKIPMIMNPLALDDILLLLNCVCNECGVPYVSKERLDRAGITRSSRKKRLQEIRELVKKDGLKCQNPECSKPPAPQYRSLRETKDEYFLHYMYTGTTTKFIRTPTEIYQIFRAIHPEDAKLLGFDSLTRPENLIMERMIVIPYCARPDLRQGSKFMADDLSTMYQDIVGKVNIYYDPTTSERDREVHYKEIFFRISNFMKNDGRYHQGPNKIYNDLKKRIQGKQAVIRGHIMGKRVNFAGRAVAGPGAFLYVDEVGIPEYMAIKLTRPILVSAQNLQELQAKYDSGRVKYIVRKNGLLQGHRVMVTEEHRKSSKKLEPGDEVHRILENGDIVLINRQPTLHKQNLLALRCRIIKDRVIRINLSITTPMNADFDGDELNLHVPQTIEAYAEAEQLASVAENLMSSQTNKPMMGIVYDALTGAYLLTYYEHEHEMLTKEISKLDDELASMEKNTNAYKTLAKTRNDKKIRLDVVSNNILIDTDLYSRCIYYLIEQPQYATLDARLAKYGVPKISGRTLFSATLPEDFDYGEEGKSQLIIRNGIMLKGYLDKKVLGNVDGSIISEMDKQFGGHETMLFMSHLQFVINEYLNQRGFSIGLNDCIPTHTDFKDYIEKEITLATIKIMELSRNKPQTKIAEMAQERQIITVLDNTKALEDNLVNKYLDPDNSMVIVSNAGTKGSRFNVAQIAAMVGLQKVNNKRIPKNLSGNRAIPTSPVGDTDPRGSGMCWNSFSTGLTPSEFFFHAQGSREGLTDTAVNTAQTGALQHQIIKSLEDVHISPDGSVRVADNTIVQFVYGDDGYEASQLTTVKILDDSIPFFRNLGLLSEKVSRKYETC